MTTQVLTIIAKERIDAHGNTYHAVKVWVDGILLGSIGETYGHGRLAHYATAALLVETQARSHALDLDINNDFRGNGFKVVYECIQVSRKKDLYESSLTPLEYYERKAIAGFERFDQDRSLVACESGIEASNGS